MSDLQAHLGPLGALRPLVTYPSVEVGIDRPSSERVTLGGHRVIQRGPRAARSWALPYRHELREDLAYLIACAHGAVVGPLYLHTIEAARGNMLADYVAAPGSGPWAPSGVGVDAVLPGAGLIPTAGIELGSAPGVWSAPIPLRGVPVMVSAWASGPGPCLEWDLVTAPGSWAPLPEDTVLDAVAYAGGYRAHALITPRPGDVALIVRAPAGPGRVGALRLTEGEHDGTWVPGVGVPQVVVDDPTQTMQLVRDGVVRSDYTVTLREVGR